MDNMDNRVRYTKMVLQQALLKILQRKNIDKVTIRELCEEAKVNRGTFYRHYTTPNDLLFEIEQQFIDENMAYFSPFMHEGYETNQLAGMFTCILENRDICRIIMGKNGNPKFLERLQEMIRTGVVENWHREYPTYGKANLDYVFDFIFTGSMRLILNWLEDDQVVSAEKLASRLNHLGYHALLAITDF